MELAQSAQKKMERMFWVVFRARKGKWRLHFKVTASNPALNFDLVENSLIPFMTGLMAKPRSSVSIT